MGAQDLIKLALAEVGYMEKRTNAQLDDKTANAGYNNYTKYARDYARHVGINVQGQPWCDTFVDEMFIAAFGVENARKLLGGFSAYTPSSANYFKNMGCWVTKNPQPADVIFFRNSERICHTGIVYRVDSGKVYTVEGNTSGAAEVVPNGGGVFKKSYALSNSRIAGYGRPKYSLVEKDEPQSEPSGSHVPLNYQVGNIYTLTTEMNVRTKLSSEETVCIPTGKVVGTKPKGTRVTCQATTLVSGKIWMYIGLDSARRENWICADSGTKSYIK